MGFFWSPNYLQTRAKGVILKCMKCIFVYNPESGNGKIKKHRDYILKELATKYGEVDCMETRKAGDATEFARNACGVYDYFFVSGGDGTINEVVNGFGENEDAPILGIIPSGTVNDVAHSLHISKNLKKAVRNLIEGEVFEHDIFKVNDRYGIYVCCTGLFSKTSYDTARYSKKRLGKLAYFLRGVKEVMTTKPTKLELHIDGEKIKKDCAMLLIFNSRSTAGFNVNKKALLDDGVVEVVVFHSHKKSIWLFDLLRTVRFFLFGVNSIRKSKNVTYRQAASFKIKLAEDTVINLDGEKSGKGTFEFNVINKGLKILIPKKTKN